MATARSAEKEAFWRMVMEEHRNSGWTIKDFCKRQGISEPSFYAWRKRLEKRDAETEMSVLKKAIAVALTIAAVSLNAASEAKAGNPLEKFFANAGRKVVGGAYQSVEKSVRQSSRLVLKAAPYALLQGSGSRGSRSNGASGSFQSSGGNSFPALSGGAINNSFQGNGLNSGPKLSFPKSRAGTFQ